MTPMRFSPEPTAARVADRMNRRDAGSAGFRWGAPALGALAFSLVLGTADPGSGTPGLAAPAPATVGSAQSSVEELAARLASADVRTRREAARELGEDGSAAAITALSAAIRDTDRGVRRNVLEALLAVRRPDAAPGLIVFLEDERAENRRAAIGGLVDIHNREAPPGRGERAVDWLLRREQEFVLDPLRPVEPPVVEALKARLSDEEADNRKVAAEALGVLKAATAVDMLAAAAVGDGEDDVRREAVRALGAIGSDQAGELLLGLLDTPALREEAVRALGRFAYRPAISALIRVYDANPASDLARDALEALARIGADEARGTFYHELGSRDARRREYAAEGLGRIGDPDLADGMIRDFLREEDRRAQLAFCFALVRLGHPAFVDRIVLSLSDSRLGSIARQYARELGRDFLAELLPYLEDPDRGVRLALIALLEEVGDADAVPALESASQNDSDIEVADRARIAARRLAGAGSGPGNNPGNKH